MEKGSPVHDVYTKEQFEKAVEEAAAKKADSKKVVQKTTFQKINDNGWLIAILIAILVGGVIIVVMKNPSTATTDSAAPAPADYKAQIDAAISQLRTEMKPSVNVSTPTQVPVPTVNIEATVAKAVEAAVAKLAPAAPVSVPAPAQLPAVEASATNDDDIVEKMNAGMRLQYGVAHVHSETTPPPGLSWLDLGQIQVPIFRNPKEGNKWAFVTGDLLNGVKTPPRAHEVPLPPGRTWILVTQANIPPSGAINPDGQDMTIDKVLLDGALIYGTVAVK
jgi:hypothetical protein